MGIQIIKQSRDIGELEDWGQVGPAEPSQAAPCVISGIQAVIAGHEKLDTGIFECTQGTFSRQVKEAEVMHFLSGRCSFTAHGRATLEINAGDTVFFPANTEGLWQIHETIRKVYVII